VKEKSKKLDERYQELIMSVERKFPNETRHETALRYIKEAESHSGNTCSVPAKESEIIRS